MTTGGRALLFRTPHGSHLYGLATPASDRDYYEVYEKAPHALARWARQSIDGDQDHMRVDLGTWLALCTKGVPQALEAMFSPVPDFDLLGPLRAGFRVETGALDTYLRTMRNFAAADDIKRRRHALRLALNGRDLARHGRFHPTLSREQARWASAVARALDGNELLDTCERTFYS